MNNETAPLNPVEVADKIRQHISGCSEVARNGGPLLDYIDDPFVLEDYVRACAHFLRVKEMLPEALLKERLAYLMQEANLKQYLEEGLRLCVTVIPVSPTGMPLDQEEIKIWNYQRNLLVDKQGITLGGFPIAPSYLFKLLPPEIQEQCTFTIDADRAKIATAFEKAFRNAQAIFKSA